MPIIHYHAGSAIDEVSILTNNSGGKRAYVHAVAGADPAMLDQIKDAIADHHWKGIATTHEGKPAIEVRGFKHPEELLGVLHTAGATGAAEKITPLDGDMLSKTQKFRNRTLKLAGLSYNIGDVSYLWYTLEKFKMQNVPGAHAGTAFFNKVDIAAGIGYVGGNIPLSVFGAREQSVNAITKASHKVQKYLIDADAQVPADSSLKRITHGKPKGFWQKMDDFVGSYPSEIMNSVYIFVGLALSSAAFYRAVVAHQHGNHVEARTEAIDIGLGAVTTTSSLIGLAVRERKIDPDERRKGLGRIIDWIEEKPLRVTGVGYAIATAFHSVSTYRNYKIGDALTRKTVIGRAIFVASNVVSELLLSVSSKGHGDGVKPDKTVDESVIAATAETLLQQPAEKRETLLANVAGYIASPAVLSTDVNEITQSLREHVKALESNPWRAASLRAHKPSQSAPVALSPALPAPTAVKDTPLTTVTAAKELFAPVHAREHALQPA